MAPVIRASSFGRTDAALNMIAQGSNNYTSGAFLLTARNAAGTGPMTGNAFILSNFPTTLLTVDANGNTGLGTSAPTHTVTHPSTSTGEAFYNTVDQTTNYERVRHVWSGNAYNIVAEAGGTGTLRNIAIGFTASSLNIGSNTQTFSLNTATGNSPRFSFTGVFNASGAAQNIVCSVPTINQTGTAGYKAFYASVYELGLGSGPKSLIDLGTNSAAAGAGTHTSKFTVSNTGKINSQGVLEYTDNAAALSAGLVSGDFYRTGDLLKIVH